VIFSMSVHLSDWFKQLMKAMRPVAASGSLERQGFSARCNALT
jgi:hypothetical protein